MGDIACAVLNVAWLILLANILLSWFPTRPGTAFAQVKGVLNQIVEPVLTPIRRLLPPVRMGAMALDLSPIIVFVVLAAVANRIGCGLGF